MTTQKSSSYSLAERINSDVNASVTYKSDLEQYSTPEFWVEAGTLGDCEDYALLKRELLKEQGFDAEKIHLATCWINVKADDTGHCVLIVETDKGQVILDNNLKDPVSLNFEAVDYKYIWNIIERGGKWYEFSVS
jgi:predicted transglutaminase-like cysteine proteinase